MMGFWMDGKLLHSMTVETKPNLNNYEVQTTFPAIRTYCYEDPAGGTPTSAATAAAIAASVNADPFAPVTATVAGSTITLTGKAGINFNVYTGSGTVLTTVPFAKAVLNTEAMMRLFRDRARKNRRSGSNVKASDLEKRQAGRGQQRMLQVIQHAKKENIVKRT
jgi:hypothetical protein